MGTCASRVRASRQAGSAAELATAVASALAAGVDAEQARL